MIDISIVIISWNMLPFLKVLLPSLYSNSQGFTFELIFIDNNSADGTADFIKENYPDIILHQNPKNLGVAPSRNQGLKMSRGRYILILDADMELVENSILKMFQYMEQNNACGLLGCKLVDSKLELQYTCKRFPSISTLFLRRLERFDSVKKSKKLNYHLMSEWDHNSIIDVDYVIGACQFFRREVMKKIGYYDDTIFYGPEDIDYCLRVWNSGWSVRYYPFTKIIHHEQRITKQKVFSAITFKHLKGIIYFFRKYHYKISRTIKNE